MPTNSTFYLLDVPLDKTQKNQIGWFPEGLPTARDTYFTSRIKHSFNDCYYIRKDNAFKANAVIDELYDSNYVMYRNPFYNNKWFYAFVDRYEYVNENTTLVYMKTDVFQTWYDEAVLKPSFVVREHVLDDTVGANLVDEGLEKGEYVYRDRQYTELLSDIYVVVATTIGDSGARTMGGVYSLLYSGASYKLFNYSDIEGISSYINGLADIGKADAIVAIFTFPVTMINPGLEVDGVLVSATQATESFSVSKNHSALDGYVPRNNKLFVYPYNVLYVSNGNGNNAEFRYEDFDTASCTFSIKGVISPNPVIYCVPTSYKNLDSSVEDAITLSGFPLCGWTYDVFKNWYAQNQAALQIQMLGGGANAVLGGIGGMMTGNPIGVASGMSGGIMQIASLMGEIERKKVEPPQVRGNMHGGASTFALGYLDFQFVRATIKAEYARMIDDFFEMFGYKVNRLKVPALYTRPYWNYVQCVDANITGAIPSNDMEELKKIYNDGVTLWHDPYKFCDYSQNNHN